VTTCPVPRQPLLGKRGVDLLVEFARWVVRHVQKLDGVLGAGRPASIIADTTASAPRTMRKDMRGTPPRNREGPTPPLRRIGTLGKPSERYLQPGEEVVRRRTVGTRRGATVKACLLIVEDDLETRVHVPVQACCPDSCSTGGATRVSEQRESLVTNAIWCSGRLPRKPPILLPLGRSSCGGSRPDSWRVRPSAPGAREQDRLGRDVFLRKCAPADFLEGDGVL